MIQWRDRLRASGIHLCISLAIATLAALLVFGFWFPYPYREISGGRDLFLIVVTVDVVLGPLITLTIFNRAKPWTELRRDLGVVGVIQLAGLLYGLWTVALARPVHLVFEIDRFRVIHAVDVPAELLDRAPKELQRLPILGPTEIGLRPFRDSREQADATMIALRGIPLGALPDLWQRYSLSRTAVLAAAKPVALLKTRFPARASEIEAVLKSAGRQAGSTSFLPMAGRKSYWTAFVDPVTAEVVAFMPLDSF
ncbi:MAG: pilus assembly protein [Ramlibacter sp.]|nr:pilus assembly protein [Ramlibacter sp.]